MKSVHIFLTLCTIFALSGHNFVFSHGTEIQKKVLSSFKYNKQIPKTFFKDCVRDTDDNDQRLYLLNMFPGLEQSFPVS